MRTLMLVGALLAVVIGAGGVYSLHQTNSRLRAQVTEKKNERAKRRIEPVMSARIPAARVVAEDRSSSGASDGVRLNQLRAEVAALEKRAAEQYAANPEQTDAPSSNLDPEQGMTTLENLRNVGQTTPAAALQTLFWAALNGDEKVMAQTIGWEDAVRPEAQRLIDRLPVEMRARYPTPEALTALFISKFALDVSAIHVSATEQKDPAHAMLTVKGLTGVDQHLPMHLGPGGWQLLAGRPMLKALSDELDGKKQGE